VEEFAAGKKVKKIYTRLNSWGMRLQKRRPKRKRSSGENVRWREYLKKNKNEKNSNKIQQVRRNG